jgi:diguanylate cyclase (GGDEF)-like protein
MKLKTNKLKSDNKQLKYEASRDNLTGWLNRNSFMPLVIKHSDNTQESLSIAFIDIDNFKKVNDTYGHDAGDEALVTLAVCFLRACRVNQSVYRMGGDEFLAVIQKMDEKAAKELLNKIRENVKNYKNDDFALELSIGSYTINNPKESFEEAVNNSDKQMYIDKKEHKNK